MKGKKQNRGQQTTVAPGFWQRAWPALALVALAFAVYADSLSNGFVSDDQFQLLDNPLVRSLGRLPEAFAHDVWRFSHPEEPSNYYRPLQMALYMLVYQIAGFHAGAYHALMIALHIAATLLGFLLGRELLKNLAPALAAAALFAVHPIHTEAVDWIACLPDVLMACFVLTALLLFVREAGEPRGWQIAGLATLFLAALLTKETGVVLWPTLVACQWLFLKHDWRRVLKNARLSAAMAGVFALYLALRVHALGALAPAHDSPHKLNATEWAMSAAEILPRYWGKLAWPVQLQYFYVFTPTRTFGFGVLMSIVLIAAFIAAIFWLRSTQPAVSFGLVVVLLPLLPVLNLGGIGENVFCERYLYLSTAGFVWIAGWAWSWARSRLGMTAVFAGSLVLAACSYATIVRNADWRDDLTIYTVAARQAPEAAGIVRGLAMSQQQAGNLDAAVAGFSHAIALNPKDRAGYNDLGVALAMQGKRDEAIAQFRKAVAVSPTFPDAYMNLGVLLSQEHHTDEAIAAEEQALRLRPNYADALNILGNMKRQAKDVSGAIALLERAVSEKPYYTEARINLGLAYYDAGRDADAMAAFERAIESGSGGFLYLAHYGLGLTYMRGGQRDNAAREMATSYQLNPNFQQAKELFEKLQR